MLSLDNAFDDEGLTEMNGDIVVITERHTESPRSVLRDLGTEYLVPAVDVQIRHVPLTPTSKLYVLNGVEVLFGPYEVIERPVVLETGEEIRALDVLGLGATLTHHMRDGTQEVVCKATSKVRRRPEALVGALHPLCRRQVHLRCRDDTRTESIGSVMSRTASPCMHKPQHPYDLRFLK
ncbi:hypothetical protein [Streptomyces sp. NPDC047453]|uniref:hypothetical protein n=1 Tax=Streptomyces sp. NPDC047453 TaxID=3154812 RepID=UPI0033D2AAD8